MCTVKESVWNFLQILAVFMLSILLLSACKSSAEQIREKLDMGQRYLEELNYTEAIIAFTEVIEIDPENISAYMNRAQAYQGAQQYEEAKSDYTTVISKTETQPYIQAQAYVGRAELGELTADEQNALKDYQSAANALEKVNLEELADVTEQMLTALKIKVYKACARLSAFFSQHEAAAASYTKALAGLAGLPDNAQVLDVPAEKAACYAGRAASNLELKEYEEVLLDYDALIQLGEDKTQERDVLLAALSLSHSQTQDLGDSNGWLEEVNHSEYSQSIQMDAMVETLQQAAALAQQEGMDAYEEIRALMTSEENQQAMQSLLARGYQLRYYDTANRRMLAVYGGEPAWADVHDTGIGTISQEKLQETRTAPTQEQLEQAQLSPLYVYYGEHKGRVREGEGLWYILNPGELDYEAQTYQWENDEPAGGFAQHEEATVQPVETVQTALQQTGQTGFAGRSGYRSFDSLSAGDQAVVRRVMAAVQVDDRNTIHGALSGSTLPYILYTEVDGYKVYICSQLPSIVEVEIRPESGQGYYYGYGQAGELTSLTYAKFHCSGWQSNGAWSYKMDNLSSENNSIEASGTAVNNRGTATDEVIRTEYEGDTWYEYRAKNGVIVEVNADPVSSALSTVLGPTLDVDLKSAVGSEVSMITFERETW